VPKPVSAFLQSVASAVVGLIDDSPPLTGCRSGRHVLRTPSLRLQTPTVRDFKMMMAAASDPQAQRWLGWSAELVVAAKAHERLLTLRAGGLGSELFAGAALCHDTDHPARCDG
jgi:predicted alpha/beta hydrolase